MLFGHHFAAISGSGPLIGPTLAAQFGFAPGFLWLLAGVVLAGAVHDFVILTASMRRNGRSLAALVREELGAVPGIVAMIAILAIIVIAIAGLGIVVVGALAESAWGTFTVGASIPIALLMGLYTYKLAPGPNAVRNATIAGIALLLCPRDYLSSYLKIGTIACGAISGFHALIASGTTPKMINKETDARMIGYGAMLMEGLVGLTALVAATSLPVNDYLAINTDPKIRLIAEANTPGLFRAEDFPRVVAQLDYALESRLLRP